MKRYKSLPIYLLFLGLLITSFVIGYGLMGRKMNIESNDIVGTRNQDLEFSNDPDLEIIREHEKISPNTLIEERIHYSTCGHIINKVDVVEEKLVNMSKEEFRTYLRENNPNKRLISYSTDKISLGVVKNHLCERHYIIGEEDGKIAIFKIGENGEKILDKVFLDYPISLLMEVDQEKIIEGIVVDDEDELSQVLENFIS